jgi:hypothetical protein
MRISGPKAGEKVTQVSFTKDAIHVDLLDGRTITAPLVWYPRLLHATPAERANWRRSRLLRSRHKASDTASACMIVHRCPDLKSGYLGGGTALG